jgi:hypothetical protein
LRITDKNSEREIEKKWKNKTKGEGGVCERERGEGREECDEMAKIRNKCKITKICNLRDCS